MITIKKFYGETVEIRGVWKKVGTTIESDKKLDSAKEVEKHSESVFKLAKKLTKEDIKKLKEEG